MFDFSSINLSDEVDMRDVETLLLSTTRTIEIAGVMFRVNSDNTFHTLSSENLNINNVGLLNTGEYSNTIMNRFSCTPNEFNDETGLLEFITNTPTGHDVGNNPGSAARFWGRSDNRYDYNPTTQICRICYDYYVFWFKTGPHCDWTPGPCPN